MKKNYFLLAATTMMFAACAQTDMVNEVVTEEAPQAIEFETFANKITKAGTGTELNTHHETFYVWGYKNVAGNDICVFYKQNVKWNAESKNTVTKWEYTPIRYWDKTATSYEFYAATPTDESWDIVTSTIDPTTSAPTSTPLAAANYYLTLTGFTLTDHDATVQSSRGTEISSFNKSSINKDLMVATSETKNALVDFTFKHILSRLNVTVSKTSDFDEETITIKDFKVINLKNKGNYTHKATSTWALATDAESMTYTTDAECVVAEDAQYLLQSLVIPQSAAYVKTFATNGENVDTTNPYIYIEYTIGASGQTETFKVYYNLADVFNSDKEEDIEFAEGNQYTLKITIEPNIISFSGDVDNWTTTNNTGGTTIE